MKNKLFAILLTACLVLGFSACKDQPAQEDSQPQQSSYDKSSSQTISFEEEERIIFTPNTTVKRYFEVKSYYDSAANTSIEYMLHQPIRETGKKYPLFIFLHGLFETVNTDSLGTAMQPVEALMTLENFDEKYTAYVLVPSTPLPNDGWWTDEQIAAFKALIYRTMIDYNVDTSRVYISGISMGGYTTCRLVNEMPANTFAAAVTFSAASSLYNPESLYKTGFRIYHAENDETISPDCSIALGEQLKAAGHPDAQYTVFDGGDHLSPLKSVFKEDRYNFFDWLFEQSIN